MQKAHDPSRNNYWKNLPNVDTPIIAEELNRNEQSVDEIDNRVVAMDTTKANQSDLLTGLKDVTWNPANGQMTFTKFNNTTVVIDTDIEKMPINLDFDSDPTSPHYQSFILTLADGTIKYIDASAFVTQFEFASTPTIKAMVLQDGTVKHDVVDGSITGAKLQPNYLADITTQANNASQSATASSNSATLSQSWAKGGTGTREGEDNDNSKHWADVAREKVAELLTAFGVNVSGTKLIFGSAFESYYHIEVVGTTLIISEP